MTKNYQAISKYNVENLFSTEELVDITSKYGTPSYVFDEKTIHDKIIILEESFAGFNGFTDIAYSMKSNFNPTLLKIFISDGVLFDITSSGELKFFLQCGGQSQNVLYNSITEQETEFNEVLKLGIKKVIINSYNGLINLITAAKKINVSPSVIIRINPQISVKAQIQAVHVNGKFGVPFTDSSKDNAYNLIRIVMNSELNFSGFHFHLGSQIDNPQCFVDTLNKLENFISKIKLDYESIKIELIDIGGGIPVEYNENTSTPTQFGNVISSKLNELSSNLGLNFNLIIESGRYLTAESGILITKVLNSKIYDNAKFLIVDSDYHLLLDSALLKQNYPKTLVSDNDINSEFKIHIGGRLCDTLDVFPNSGKNNISDANIGDLIIFHNVGAYSIVFNMPFHCQTKPVILLRRLDGKIEVIRKAETIENLFSNEGGNVN